MHILTLTHLIAVIWHTSGQLLSPVVDLPLGKIEGKYSLFGLTPLKEFLGVPFAKPALGKLRFLKPEPVEHWNGTIKATKQPPACQQYTKAPFPWYDDKPGKSEDCLYLDIYARRTASERRKKPVMFWIYGGGFSFGSNRMDVYDGRPLAAREDIVVVVINYRVGALGFLTTNTPDAPGNQGFYDTLEALKWVNKYIGYFGGDKDKITIAGESGGSIVVSLLGVSPLAKGLFKQGIMESASVAFYRNNMLPNNLDLSNKVAMNAGCATNSSNIYNQPKKVVECLRKKTGFEVTYAMYKSLPPTAGRSFYPQYGDALLPDNALKDLQNGKFNNFTMLAGSNRDEGSFQITTGNSQVFGFFGDKDPKINKTYATSLLEGTFSNYTDPQKYINFYLKDVPDTDYDLIRRQTYTASGDTSLLCPTFYNAETYAESNNNVYYYFFTHRPSNSPWAPWMGVVHFEEVQFVFGRPVRVPKDYTLKENLLSRKMMNLWGNFIKNGKPTPGLSDKKWPKFDKKSHTYFTLDTKGYGTLGTGPHLKNCNFIRSYFGF